MRFFLIDRIREFVADERVVTVKNVTMESAYFDQHFPQFPIFPGVLSIEAMAQASGYLIARTVLERENKRILTMFSGIGQARFLRAVRPGDQLVVEARLTSLEASLATTQAQAKVDGKVVSRANLSFAYKEFKGEPHYAAAIAHAEVYSRILEGAWGDDLWGGES